MISIVVADDHTLVRKGLVNILCCDGFEVIGDVENGKELLDFLAHRTPDVVVMDCSMPVMDGIQATEWLTQNMPHIKVLALSMNNDDITIIRMLRAGAKGYVLKGAQTNELKRAVQSVVESGFYYSDVVSRPLTGILNGTIPQKEKTLELVEREVTFLKLCCTEKTYKEIAADMFVSPRTVDGYRETLFTKLNVQSRVGLVLYALRNGLTSI